MEWSVLHAVVASIAAAEDDDFKRGHYEAAARQKALTAVADEADQGAGKRVLKPRARRRHFADEADQGAGKLVLKPRARRRHLAEGREGHGRLRRAGSCDHDCDSACKSECDGSCDRGAMVDCDEGCGGGEFSCNGGCDESQYWSCDTGCDDGCDTGCDG